MLASLPMYDLPELRAETDALWDGFARAFRAEGLRNVPQALTRGDDVMAQWTASDLMFSQTCGYPLTHALSGRVTLVATPLYDCPGCAGGTYRSEILVRADDPAASLADLRGRGVAVNGRDSQSGYSALRHAVAGLAEDGRFFGAVTVTGSHRASMQAVAAGQADVCAADVVTYTLLQRAAPDVTRRLRVLAHTAAAPALPYISRRDLPADDLRRLQAGLMRACGDPALNDARQALLLAGVAMMPLSAYDRILELEAAAVAAGYSDLT
ncbi:MAG: phosphate/phosphite/phosphonate ABC transporter substrate-binding protein [Kiloniellaceae bacterium]